MWTQNIYATKSGGKSQSPTFRANVLFGCINEVHLINFWDLSFRTAFVTIGAFLRGRFPASMSVVGLTATLEPGPSTISVCKSLGSFKNNFTFIRRSNECPNTQFTVQFITRLELLRDFRHLNNKFFLVGANTLDLLFHRYRFFNEIRIEFVATGSVVKV